MRFASTAIALAAFASSALAHMDMQEPAPFRSKFNKNVPSEKVDFDMVAPLNADGSDFPCKGFLSDFDQSPDGDPTATWAPGSKQQVTIVGGADHLGGSCQLSLSFDKGKTFRVVKSFEGSCPIESPQNFDFTVPDNTKSGKAVFAWTWFNEVGNREMYMNCAAVDITGNGTSELEDRPEIFVANIGDSQCTVPEGTDVKFPNPGPDVEVLAEDKLAPPTGQCGNDSPAPEPETPTSEEPAPEVSTDPSTEPTATESVEPTPTDSGDDDDEEPTSTADPNESSEPSKSAYPSEPVDEPTESAEPSKSVDEPEPTESTEPSKSESESEPAAEPTPTPTKESSTSKAPVSTTTTPGSSVGTTYTVKTGDICQDIAASQGVSLSKLLELNPGINDACTNLLPGQVLNLRRRSRVMRYLN